MRLLLEALPHMLQPSRVTRRLIKRPYFAEARELLDLIAPIYGTTSGALERFLAAGSQFSQPQSHGPDDRNSHTSGDWTRRRRRRRGGRRRNTAHSPAPLDTI